MLNANIKNEFSNFKFLFRWVTIIAMKGICSNQNIHFDGYQNWYEKCFKISFADTSPKFCIKKQETIYILRKIKNNEDQTETRNYLKNEIVTLNNKYRAKYRRCNQKTHHLSRCSKSKRGKKHCCDKIRKNSRVCRSVNLPFLPISYVVEAESTLVPFPLVSTYAL